MGDIYRTLERFHRRFGENRVLVHPRAENAVRLTSSGGGAAMVVESVQLREMIGAGLLVARTDCLVLSDAGLAALRRRGEKEEPFLAQHKVLSKSGDASTIDLQESPLGWLTARRTSDGKPYLAPYETEAGERLRRDFTLAGLNRRICMSWEPSAGRSKGKMRGNHAADLSDFAIDAHKRLDKALLALEPNLRDVLLDICCFLKGLEQVERERRWPRRSAKLVLKIGLAQLAHHYGLLPRQHSGGIRHWRDEGYRSSLSGSDATPEG